MFIATFGTLVDMIVYDPRKQGGYTRLIISPVSSVFAMVYARIKREAASQWMCWGVAFMLYTILLFAVRFYL